MQNNLPQDPWPRWLSVRKAAEYTGHLLGEKRILELVSKGKIRGGRDKGRKDKPWFIDRKSIDAYFNNQIDGVEQAVNDVLTRAGIRKKRPDLQKRDW